MRLAAFVVFGVLLAIAARLLFVVVPGSGYLARLENAVVDQCRRVDIFPGAEDVEIDEDLGLAFISADDRRATARGAPVQGGIYALRLDGTDRVSRVSPDNFGAFHPHGISLFTGAQGQKRLFVVNHASADEEIVEIFDVGTGGALIHIESVSFDAMTSPNDVAAVGARAFYVTNDRGAKSGVMSTLEAYLALPLSSLAFYDGQTGSIAKSGLVYANGVAASADGSKVYVAELLTRRIAVFDRDAQTGALARSGAFNVPTAPDNIDIAPDGALFVAGHSRIFDFLKHAEDETAIAPSHAVRIDPDNGGVDTVFVDVNGVINASSVAAASNEALIIGGVFDGHVLVCPR